MSQQTNSYTTRPSRSTIVVAAIWFLLVAIGAVAMTARSTAPGQGDPARSVPTTWPEESLIPRSNSTTSVMLFVHPHCVCTRATLAELERALSFGAATIDVRVLFLRPAGVPNDWHLGTLWDTVSSNPNTVPIVDDGGDEARRFGITTSGHLLAYDIDGRLLFHGGITPSRGHHGGSYGRSSLIALINGKPIERPTTPVHGCPLWHASTVDCCAESMEKTECRS